MTVSCAEEEAMLDMEEFAFADRSGRKKLNHHSREVVDEHGADAEKIFRAALDLGERIQVRVQISKKSFANIYQFCLAAVLKTYDLPASSEADMKGILFKYWEHADRLREALGEMDPARVAAPAEKRSGLRVTWDAASDSAPEGPEPLCRHDDRDSYALYSFRREVGVR